VLAFLPSRDRRKEEPNKGAGRGVSLPFTGEVPIDDPDQADLARFLDGDAAGFEALMTRYRRQAYGIALGLCGNHDDAMDSVQKAFIRMHRSLPRFRLGQPFFPWFYRIVRNAALNQRRDERRHQGDVPLEWVDKPSNAVSPLAAAEAEQLKSLLWDGIQRLSPELREVFNLFHFQGLKYREIAAALDIPLGTVMSRLHAARQQLRRSLGEEASA
jgi:RNA polymerase sigma-70 factor, ECF subfamily